MLMNANTATRSFRELQFDLRAFLSAMLDICPLDSTESSAFVEIRWSDGSVDVVPTFAAISRIVGNLYPSLTVGDSARLYPSTAQGGDNYRHDLTLFIASSGLSCHIEEMGTPQDSLVIVRGIIRNLSAEVVELADDIDVSSLKVTGILSAEECTADSVDARSLSYDRVYVRDGLDLSRVRFGACLRFILGGTDISVCTYAPYMASGDLLGCYRITGRMRYSVSVSEATRRVFESSTPHVYVDVPTVSFGSDGKPFFDYVPTAGEDMPVDGITPFTDAGDASLMLLYPRKSVRYGTSVSEAYIRAVAPTDSDADRIVQVCNVTDIPIRACNAWMFSTEAVGSDAPTVGGMFSVQAVSARRGTVSALNYVELPPYSSIDFLFKFDLAGASLRVYMMPMRHLQ